MLGAAAAFIITPAPIDLSRASEESSQLFTSIPARGNLPPAMSWLLPCGACCGWRKWTRWNLRATSEALPASFLAAATCRRP
tara:strand:- start:2863 stop:3108 length:246 start_codon:yes stop_codon:yes gene_type:complete